MDFILWEQYFQELLTPSLGRSCRSTNIIRSHWKQFEDMKFGQRKSYERHSRMFWEWECSESINGGWLLLNIATRSIRWWVQTKLRSKNVCRLVGLLRYVRIILRIIFVFNLTFGESKTVEKVCCPVFWTFKLAHTMSKYIGRSCTTNVTNRFRKKCER